MATKTKAQTLTDPHLGKVTFRPLTPGQLRAVSKQVEDIDLDAEVARLDDTGGLSRGELRREVEHVIVTRAILRRAIADVSVRGRLGLDDDSSISEADGRAFHRIGAVVRRASGEDV